MVVNEYHQSVNSLDPEPDGSNLFETITAITDSEIFYPNFRVHTSSGNHGKPGKSLKKVPCMEKSWNFVK